MPLLGCNRASATSTVEKVCWATVDVWFLGSSVRASAAPRRCCAVLFNRAAARRHRRRRRLRATAHLPPLAAASPNPTRAAGAAQPLLPLLPQAQGRAEGLGGHGADGRIDARAGGLSSSRRRARSPAARGCTHASCPHAPSLPLPTPTGGRCGPGKSRPHPRRPGLPGLHRRALRGQRGARRGARRHSCPRHCWCAVIDGSTPALHGNSVFVACTATTSLSSTLPRRAHRDTG